jgi:hypothetical protein
MDIDEEISKFYPIGLTESDPLYYRSEEWRRHQMVLETRNDADVVQKWKVLLSGLTRHLVNAADVKSTSNELRPSFSLEILLFTEKTQMVTYTRQIQLHLSLLAPFYTIVGWDLVYLNQVQRWLDPLVYISPTSIYEKWFPLIRNQVKEAYPKYVFLPHYRWAGRVSHLSVPGAEECYDPDASVFQALFMPRNVGNYHMIGDDLYE